MVREGRLWPESESAWANRVQFERRQERSHRLRLESERANRVSVKGNTVNDESTLPVAKTR